MFKSDVYISAKVIFQQPYLLLLMLQIRLLFFVIIICQQWINSRKHRNKSKEKVSVLTSSNIFLISVNTADMKALFAQ